MKFPGILGKGRSEQTYEEKSTSRLLSKQVIIECLLCGSGQELWKTRQMFNLIPTLKDIEILLSVTFQAQDVRTQRNLKDLDFMCI